MATDTPLSTTGVLGMWDGTKDGEEDGYIDYATGVSNLNNPKEYEIKVYDIRKLDSQPTLKGNGYQLVDIPTAVTEEQFLASNRTDEGKAYIEDVYFQECKRIIEQVAGSVSLTLPTSFRVREQKGNKKSTEDKLGSLEARFAPRPIAHLDRDPPTAQEVLEETVAEYVEAHRKYSMAGNPAIMWPLCFMNHDRIPEWNYDTYTGRVYSRNHPWGVGGRGGKSYDCVTKHDERYDYYYVSSLRPEECLVFCSFDSDPKYVIPHSAFWDKSIPEDAPDRRSIEVRSLVFF
ncbi:hypothetical protein PG987_007383 [Apiospora arundinis]